MAIPATADQIVIQGYLFDEQTGGGVQQKITCEPVPLTGQSTTPMVLDAVAHAHIQTRTRETIADSVTGYWAVLALSTNDPDVDAYGGRKVTLPGQQPRTVQVPFDAPQVTVSANMAAQLNPQNLPSLPRVDDTVRAIWFHEAAGFVAPPAGQAWLDADQTVSTIATAVEAHDDDPDAHQDIRDLIGSGGGGGAPSGDAGGVLSGTYPNPGFAQDMATQSELNAVGSSKADASALTSHTGNTSNPHSVTKTQVGLGSVDNVSAANLRDRSTHTGSQASTTISDFTEAVQDAVAGLLGAGSNVVLNYNDAANTLTVSATGDGAGLDAEAVRDAIGVALVGAGNISVVVNDAADTITVSTTATQNSTDAALRDRGTHTGTQATSTVTGLDTALAAKAPLASPAFTGTPTGITKTHVGLGAVDNTADTGKPVSTAQQAAITTAVAVHDDDDAAHPDIRALIGAGGAPTALPVHAGTGRTGRFDPARSVYNATGPALRNARANLAKAAARTGAARVLFIGDSVTVGVGAAPGTTDPVAQFRAVLGAAGHVVGGLSLPFNNNAADSRWAIGAGWSPGTTNSPFRSSTTPGSVMTYTSDNAGTVVEIVSTARSGAWSYSIDGAAAVTFVPNNTDTVQTVRVTGLANTRHTITITSGPASPVNYIFAAGVLPDAGMVVTNAGVAGAKSSDWVPDVYYRSLSAALGTSPDLTVVELMLNDRSQAVPVATYQANLAATVTAIKAVDSDVVLVTSHLTSADLLDYVAAAYAVADAQNVPLLDLTDRLGSTADRADEGQDADGTHLTAAGYSAKAQAYAELASPRGSQTPQARPVYRAVSRSGGNLTVSATTPTALDGTGALDLVLPAVAGDLLQVTLNAQAASGASAMDFNVALLDAAGTEIRRFAPGNGTIGAFTLRPNDFFGGSGVVAIPVQSGDVAYGKVTLRLLAKVGSGTRDLLATTATPLSWYAINFGLST